MPVYDDSEVPKRILLNRHDGTGEFEPSAAYVNDQDGSGERLVYSPGGALIASFEGAEFDDAWGGRKDTVDGDLVTTTERALDGTNALRSPGGSFDATQSNPGDGLPYYVGIPTRHRFYIWFDDWPTSNVWWRFVRRNNGNDDVSVRFWGPDNSVYINEMLDGSTNNLVSAQSVNLPAGEWLEVTVTVNDSNAEFDTSLEALEPRVEIWTINADLSRNTEVLTFEGSDSGTSTYTVDPSNEVADGVGGYQWEFQSDQINDVDYIHQVDK